MFFILTFSHGCATIKTEIIYKQKGEKQMNSNGIHKANIFHLRLQIPTSRALCIDYQRMILLTNRA